MNFKDILQAKIPKPTDNPEIIFNYLKKISILLRYSSIYKRFSLHFDLANKLNEPEICRLCEFLLSQKNGIIVLKKIISSINYSSIYSHHKKYELAYFYKSIPNLCTVSIVVPVYNVENYLERCLNSILTQTWSNIKIICIDDGSKDSSPSILDRYAKKDSRMYVVRTKNNGMSLARNIGINLCNSEYLTFVDSDDFIPRNFIENMYYSIILPRIDLVCGNSKIISLDTYFRSENIQKWADTFNHPTGIYKISHDLGNFIYPSVWGKMYKLSIIRSNNIYFPPHLMHEDQSWIIQYAIHCKFLFHINEYTYFYCMTHNSVTRNSKKHLSNRFLTDLLKVHIFLFQKISKFSQRKLYDDNLAKYLLSHIYFSASKIDFLIDDKIYQLLKKYSYLNPMFSKYVFFSLKDLYLARIDITWQEGNYCSVLSRDTSVSYPDWMNKVGMVIENFQNSYSYEFEVQEAGGISLFLRSKDILINGKRLLIPIIYTSLKINGKQLLRKKIKVDHDHAKELKFFTQKKQKLHIDIQYKSILDYKSIEDNLLLFEKILNLYHLQLNKHKLIYIKKVP